MSVFSSNKFNNNCKWTICSPVKLYCRGLFIITFAAITYPSNAQSPYTEDETPPSCHWIMPGLRIAFVELGMQASARVIWPETYNVTFLPHNWNQFTRSWSSFPEYTPRRNIFSTDGDWWSFNLTLHGLFGSEAYLAARDWHLRPSIAFIYAVLASFTWEYGIESWSKQPSAIDLFWTPMGGALLGEMRYQGYLAAKHRIVSPKIRALVLALLDPLGELERLLLQMN